MEARAAGQPNQVPLLPRGPACLRGAQCPPTSWPVGQRSKRVLVGRSTLAGRAVALMHRVEYHPAAGFMPWAAGGRHRRGSPGTVRRPRRGRRHSSAGSFVEGMRLCPVWSRTRDPSYYPAHPGAYQQAAAAHRTGLCARNGFIDREAFYLVTG